MRDKFKNFIKRINYDILLVLISILALTPVVVSHPQILIYLAIAGVCMYLSKRL